jgi:malonyl-CoA O-methyltransferase
VNAIAAVEAYRLWAPSYSAETAISQIDDELVAALTPPLAGLRLLDAGCGTGRRLLDVDAEQAVGIDVSAEMLRAGARQLADRSRIRTVMGDVRALPFADASFDVAWCRLVIGHVPDCRPVYSELARVVAPNGRVIVSDFHAIAYAAGHRRRFRAGEQVHEVEHYVHDLPTQLQAAAGVGLESVAVKEGCVGSAVEHFYRSRQQTDRYREHLGLPVVLALGFRRVA